MNIETVANNLRNTIAGKELKLAEIKTTLGTWGRDPHYTAIKEMLAVNIAELKRILQDVEQCRPEWNVHTCPYTETCHRID